MEKIEARTLKVPGNQQQNRSSCPPMSSGFLPWFPTGRMGSQWRGFRSWMEGENPQPRILYGTLDQTIGFFHHLLPVLGWSSKVADITFRSLISLVSNVHVSALNRFRKLCHFCLVVLRKKAVMFPRCFHISSSAFGFVKFLAQNSSQKSTFKIKLADSKKNGVECASGLSIGSHHHPYH